MITFHPATEVDEFDTIVDAQGRSILVHTVTHRRAYGRTLVDLRGSYADGTPWSNSYEANKKIALEG